MKKKVKWILAAVIVLLCGAAYTWQSLKPVAVELETLAAGPLQDSFTVQGYLIPEQSLVINANASGTLTGFTYRPGLTVPGGTLIATLQTDSQSELAIQTEQLRQQLAELEHSRRQADNTGSKQQLEAAIAAAQSSLELAEWQYQTAQQIELAMPGAYSQAQLLELEHGAKQAEQALLTAQGALETQNTSLDSSYFSSMTGSIRKQLQILAEEQKQQKDLLFPYDAVIWEVYAEEGAFVTKYQPLLKLYRQGELKIEAALLAADRLILDQVTEIHCELADGSSFAAEISFISEVAADAVSAIGLTENRCTVELTAEQLPPSLGAGHELDVVFSRLLAENALTVPASAIVPVATGSAVYLFAEGKALLTPVETGQRSGGRVEILQGLSAGQQIIRDPYAADITDGKRVEQVAAEL